jgi:hypothetical protein
MFTKKASQFLEKLVALENRQGILSPYLDCLCEKTPIVLSACCNAYSPLRQPAMDEVDHHTLRREWYFELLCMSYLVVCEFLFTCSFCEGPIPHPMCSYFQSPTITVVQLFRYASVCFWPNLLLKSELQ